MLTYLASCSGCCTQKVDFEAASDWDIIADTVEGVADELDCPKI